MYNTYLLRLLLLALALSVTACGTQITTRDDDDDDSSATDDDDDSSATDDDDDATGGDETVFDIQSGVVAPGSVVQVDGVVVTGIAGGYALFVAEPAGGPQSGIWVYVGDGASAFSRGDLVDIVAMVLEYDGPNGDWGGSITELDVGVDPSLYSVTAAGAGSKPAASVVDAATFADPVAIESYEGCLVELQNVAVVTPDMSFGEWEVTGGILIDDILMDRPEDLAVGQSFSSITGVLHFNYGNFKIEPRDAADLIN